MKTHFLILLIIGLGSLGIESTIGCSASNSAPSPGLSDTCGNRVVDSGEACDDGNTTTGDGCNANCQVENSYTCSGIPSLCTKQITQIPTPHGKPPTIVPGKRNVLFVSAEALDGTDTANTNNTTNIWEVNLDGTVVTPFTHLTSGEFLADLSNVVFSPQWSPDGSQIIFASEGALDGSDHIASTTNIWVMNADRTGATPLTKLTASTYACFLSNCPPPVSADSVSPQWSPDGTQIAFSSSRSLDGSDNGSVNGTSNIWIMKSDGTGQIPLTHLTSLLADSISPRWSPDGSQILFVSRRSLDGSDHANTTCQYPVANIWVMKLDGTNAKPLTNMGACYTDSANPQWSPDGTVIAFESQRALDGSDNPNTKVIPPPYYNVASNIWVMNEDGTDAAPLTKMTAPFNGCHHPQWSPDETKIIFSSLKGLNGSDLTIAGAMNNIWVINPDGTGATPLTKTSLCSNDTLANFYDSLGWTQDGSKIVFKSNCDLNGIGDGNTNGASNIWSMNPDGTEATALTRWTTYFGSAPQP